MAVDSIGWNEPVQTGEDENGTPVGVSGWDAAQGDREFERQGRDAYGDDWMSALNAQEHQRKWAEDRAIAQQSERVFNDLNNIALRDQQQKIQKRQMDDATLSALMRQAQTNNGFVPASVLEAASQNLGVPLAGANFGEDGMFYLWGRDGKTGQMVPIGGATPEMQYGVYERSRTGLAQRQKIFDNLSRRFTPEQLAKFGIRDTRGAVEVSPGVRDKGGMFSQMMDPWKGRHSSIGAFSADGRGGFTEYYSGDETGHQLVSRDFGTRATDGAEQWRQISVGADPDSDDGTQLRRYENSRTGEVVSVRDGETPPWEERGRGEKERIARMREQGLNDRATSRDNTRRDIADAANVLKKYGIDVSAQLKERGLDIQQQNADERSAHNQAVEAQQAENEKGRNDRAKRANELKTKMAEMKSRGTIGGRPPTTHEYVEALRFANDLLNDEADRNAMREHAKRIEESLKQRGEKIPEPPPPPGKTEVEPGNNGGNASRTAQEIRANPQDGDELPLKGGGKARYNGKTKKWEKAQ